VHQSHDEPSPTGQDRASTDCGRPRPSWLDPAYYKEKIASVLAHDTADTLPEAHGAAAVQEVQVS